jgi:protein-disulfide isomerase
VVIAIAALAAVGGLIALQAANSGSTALPDRLATGEGRTLGSPDAPVTVVLYADFQCPACKRAELDVVPRLEEEYVLPGKVNIEFRMFPFLGQESWDAAQAAEAAREQGKFWEYHDALWNAQAGENRGAFRYDRLVELAREVGLDVERFEATLTSNVYLDPIQQEADAAREAGVASTPTFFIGGEKIVGAQDSAVFQAAVEQALAEAQQ